VCATLVLGAQFLETFFINTHCNSLPGALEVPCKCIPAFRGYSIFFKGYINPLYSGHLVQCKSLLKYVFLPERLGSRIQGKSKWRS
jgi:hypothetical protein